MERVSNPFVYKTIPPERHAAFGAFSLYKLALRSRPTVISDNSFSVSAFVAAVASQYAPCPRRDRTYHLSDVR